MFRWMMLVDHVSVSLPSRLGSLKRQLDVMDLFCLRYGLLFSGRPAVGISLTYSLQAE